jgi:hypothetical protein
MTDDHVYYREAAQAIQKIKAQEWLGPVSVYQLVGHDTLRMSLIINLEIKIFVTLLCHYARVLFREYAPQVMMTPR